MWTDPALTTHDASPDGNKRAFSFWRVVLLIFLPMFLFVLTILSLHGIMHPGEQGFDPIAVIFFALFGSLVAFVTSPAIFALSVFAVFVELLYVANCVRLFSMFVLIGGAIGLWTTAIVMVISDMLDLSGILMKVILFFSVHAAAVVLIYWRRKDGWKLKGTIHDD